MNKENLKQHLLSDQTKLFCVLDGAAIPDLPTHLYEMDPPNYCLAPGELEPEAAFVAPYVVQLLPNHKFTDWVLNESFGKNWGIFVQCPYSITEMRRHFRSLVSVYDEEGNMMFFRFFDPRVLRQFLPTCDTEELKTFFGKVQRYFAEDATDDNLLGFELENGNLKESKFTLTSNQ